MENTFVIRELDHLKVFADPLRQKILSTCCCEPATTKQIAEILGEKPTRLYHHMDLLEQAGLVVLVDTQQKRGTIEKYYMAAARCIVVDRSLLTVDEQYVTETMQQTLISTLQENLADAHTRFDSSAPGEDACCQQMMLVSEVLTLTQAQADAFLEKARQWLQETAAPLEHENGDRAFRFTFTFFPVETGQEEE